MAKPRRPKHYDRPGYRPGPEGKGSYGDQKGTEDARQQIVETEIVGWERKNGQKVPIHRLKNPMPLRDLEQRAGRKGDE